jgi:hypothetical protein
VTKLALMIAMVSIVVVLGIGAIGVWLTAEARVFGLIVLLIPILILLVGLPVAAILRLLVDGTAWVAGLVG